MNTTRAAQIAYVLLRLVVGLLFFHHGAMKMLGWFGGMPDGPSPPPFPGMIWIGGVLELVGGVAIMLGLLTRPVAFILSGMMAVAYWKFHAPGGTWPIVNHGELAVLYCFIFLYMAGHGGGDFSLDALIRRRRGAAADGR